MESNEKINFSKTHFYKTTALILHCIFGSFTSENLNVRFEPLKKSNNSSGTLIANNVHSNSFKRNGTKTNENTTVTVRLLTANTYYNFISQRNLRIF